MRIKIIASVCVLFVGRMTLFAAVPSEEYIVRDGAAVAQIVIAEQPARMTRLAAAELQSNIEKISGAKLPIATEPAAGKTNIYVGISKYSERLGISTKGLAHGAFQIASGPGWLALVGPDKDFGPPIEPYIHARTTNEKRRVLKEWDAITGGTYENPYTNLYGDYHKNLDIWAHDDGGTINAVYYFLRSLGARWYFPGKLGEVLPRLTDIKSPAVTKTVRPDFDLRQLRYFWAREGMSEDEVLWNLRMGVNQGHEIIGLIQPAHGLKFVHMRPEFQKAHPDYFTIGGGPKSKKTEGTGRPCLTSEGLFQEHLKFARSVFDHYKEPSLSIDLPDGYGSLCQHEACQKQGTPERGYQGRMSDYVWNYLNRVASDLYKSHPDRMVTGIAYAGFQLPPKTIDQLSPNIGVIECRHRSRFNNAEVRESFRNLREEWLKKLPSKQYFIWDYYLDARPNTVMSGRPAYFPHLIAEDLRSLKGKSRGDTIEVYRHPHHLSHQFNWNDFAVSHLNLYVTSQFWWDADQNVDELLEEFYTLFYGPAREPMKAFIEYSERNYSAMGRDLKTIDHAQELLQAAQNSVEPDSIYGQRIAMVAEFMKQMQPLRESLAKGRQGPEIKIPTMAASGIKLDGHADDAFWSNVPELKLKENITSKGPAEPTSLRAAWGDNNSLYLYIRCEDSDMKGLEDIARTDDDTAVWAGDFVEILLSTPASSYYQIAVSPSGRVLDLDRNAGQLNTFWSSGAKVATSRGNGHWAVEIQIPAAGDSARELDPDEGVSGDKPTKGAPWYFNIGRQRLRGNERELSAFSPTGRPRFGDALKFGRLQVEE